MIEKLLLEDQTAAYWNGFIFADGTILKGKRLRISLAGKDYNHLLKFTKWIGGKDPATYISNQGLSYTTFARQETNNVEEYCSRFDLKPKKTYNPPNFIPYGNLTLMKCWLAGFIDGDGEIRKQTNRPASIIKTVSHIEWHFFLEQVVDITQFGHVKQRPGLPYTEIRSFEHNKNVEFKQFCYNAGLPVMERKWSQIDETHVSVGQMKNRVLDLLKQGVRQRTIAQTLGCAESYVSRLNKERKVSEE